DRRAGAEPCSRGPVSRPGAGPDAAAGTVGPLRRAGPADGVFELRARHGTSMASVDLIILLVVAVSALIGLARGLLKAVLSLTTLLAAFLLALYCGPAVSECMVVPISVCAVRLVVALIAIFLSTLVAGGLVQCLARTLVRFTGLSGTDCFLGFLFGGA